MNHTLERNPHVTTAPARPTLLGPDGQALTTVSLPEPANDWKPVQRTTNGTVWEKSRGLPAIDLVGQAQASADAVLTDAQHKADRITNEARANRERILAEANTEAARLREQAAVTTARKQGNNKAVDTWMGRAVIAGTVGLTATGEYSLARLAHFPGSVAWLLPFVIDAYVIQAFRRHRDILPAICLTIAANVVYHLAAAGLFGVESVGKGEYRATWWLIAMVASIASVILWRMHVITAPQSGGESADESPLIPVGQPSQPATLTGVETPADSANERASESGAESAVERGTPPTRDSSHERASESGGSNTRNSHRAGGERASSGSRGRSTRRRERTAKAPAASASESEVAALVALMKERGSAESVSLSDAKRIAAGRSEATAARRLQTARAQYASQK